MTVVRTPRDREVLLARKYQFTVMQMVRALEEELVKGCFQDAEIRKVMLQLRLQLADALQDIAMAGLVTGEEEETVSLFEAELAQGMQKADLRIDRVSISQLRRWIR